MLRRFFIRAFILVCAFADAVVVIGVDVVDAINEHPAYIRLVQYDVSNQKFGLIEYFNNSSLFNSKSKLNTYFKIESTKELVLSKMTNLKLPQGTFLLIKDVGVQVGYKQVGLDTVSAKKIYMHQNEDFCATEELLALLKNYQTIIDNGSVFKANIYDSIIKEGDTVLVTEGSCLRKDEKGRLGELVTDCTMFAYGFKKLASKLNGGSDNGIDGIFEKNNVIYLTESKLRSDIWSYNDFYKDLDLLDIERKIEEKYKTNLIIYNAFKNALQLKQLYIVGQTYLTNGHMKSAYIWFAGSVVQADQITNDVLKEKLNELLKKHGNNVTALAKALDVSRGTLQSFFNREGQESSPTVKAKFLKYVNDNDAVRLEFFPEETVASANSEPKELLQKLEDAIKELQIDDFIAQDPEFRNIMASIGKHPEFVKPLSKILNYLSSQISADGTDEGSAGDESDSISSQEEPKVQNSSDDETDAAHPKEGFSTPKPANKNSNVKQSDVEAASSVTVKKAS